MRDGERIKEKIEIILDSRQVVSIVLGAAVVLGTVFYLGVTVGRDLAGADKPTAVDPLERLDQQALARPLVEEKLTFAESLTGEPLPEAPAAIGKAEAEASLARAEAAKAEAAKAEAAKAEAAKAEAAKAEAARAEAAKAEAARAEAPKPAATAEAPKPAAKAEAPKPAATAGAPKPAATQAAGGFSVQVGAFPTRSEADALVARLRSQGLSPYVVAAEVPGKGLFHRVRLGRFQNREEARRYLEDLQRETSVSGFVAQVDG